MSHKIIITDIDGCLTSEGSVPFGLDDLSEFTELSRRAARGEGPCPPIALCTGRPQPYVEVLLKLFGIHLPAICENGAVIYTLEDNWARYGPGVTAEKVHGLRQVREFIETDLLPRHRGTLVQYGKEAQISVYCGNPEILPRFIDPIRAFAERNSGPALDISASHFYLNVSLSGINKGRAIRWLLEEQGLTKSNAVGIGDTVGDLPIKENVGWFGCPANSHDDLKAVSDYVSPHPELRGTIDIIHRVLGHHQVG